MFEMLTNAKKTVPSLVGLTNEERSLALRNMASALLRNEDTILSANKADMDAARAHISPVMLDRLALTSQRIKAMADGILAVAALPDPLSLELDSYTRPDGLLIKKVSVPMGVVAIIYSHKWTWNKAAVCDGGNASCVIPDGATAYFFERAWEEDGLPVYQTTPVYFVEKK